MQQRSDVVKLFVGQIPKTLEEDGVREVFQEFGDIVEIVILRDRRSGVHQGCCFVKYSNVSAAQAAIAALHNQRSLPPLRNPLQVRFAESGTNAAERGQSNAENKLFVGGVPSCCGDKELRSLFSTYGEVQDVYILASKEGQRGCAFVRYATPQSCSMAIEALHGKYAMKAGELPLVVRYADPPKSQRNNHQMFGGSNGAPALWPPGPPPPGWPMPWGLGGAMGMGPYPPWVMPGMSQPGSSPPYNFYSQFQQQQGQQGQGQGHGQGHQSQPQQKAQQAQQAQQPPAQAPPQQPPQQPQPTGSAASQYNGAAPTPPPPPPAGADAGTQPPPPGQPSAVSSSAWSEHHTPEGMKYYYNNVTCTSSWECPAELRQAPAPPPAPAGAGPTVSALAPAMAALSMSGTMPQPPPMSMGLDAGYAAMAGKDALPNGVSAMGYPNGNGNIGPASLNGLPTMAGAPPNGISGQEAIGVNSLPGLGAIGNSNSGAPAPASSGMVNFDSPMSAVHAVSSMNGLAMSGEQGLQVVGMPY